LANIIDPFHTWLHKNVNFQTFEWLYQHVSACHSILQKQCTFKGSEMVLQLQVQCIH